MSNGAAELEQRLAALRAAFADKLADRLGEIEAAVRSLGEGGGDGRLALLSLRDQAHKLSGAGGTFGFDDLGREAGELEVLCDSLIDRGDGPSAADIEEIEDFLARLKTAAGSPKGG